MSIWKKIFKNIIFKTIDFVSDRLFDNYFFWPLSWIAKIMGEVYWRTGTELFLFLFQK